MPTLDLDPEYLARLRRLPATHAAGAEIWAYGSRVTGAAHAGSDLDLVIRHPGAGGIGLSRLKGAIAESDLPILTDVHDWARFPDAFRREIDETRVVVLERGGTHDGL